MLIRYSYFDGNTVALYQKYLTSSNTPFTCSITPQNPALICQMNGVTVGYLQYTNNLYKWMYYNPAGYNDYDEKNYPTYSATVILV